MTSSLSSAEIIFFRLTCTMANYPTNLSTKWRHTLWTSFSVRTIIFVNLIKMQINMDFVVRVIVISLNGQCHKEHARNFLLKNWKKWLKWQKWAYTMRICIQWVCLFVLYLIGYRRDIGVNDDYFYWGRGKSSLNWFIVIPHYTLTSVPFVDIHFKSRVIIPKHQDWSNGSGRPTKGLTKYIFYGFHGRMRTVAVPSHVGPMNVVIPQAIWAASWGCYWERVWWRCVNCSISSSIIVSESYTTEGKSTRKLMKRPLEQFNTMVPFY